MLKNNNKLQNKITTHNNSCNSFHIICKYRNKFRKNIRAGRWIKLDYLVEILFNKLVISVLK
jgi:hypothetical protein